MRLIEAPIGLLDCDGTIILKTEYSTPHTIDCETKISPDCYIVESGEYFWGGVDSVEARNNLEVTPVEMPTLTQPNEWISVEERLPGMSGNYICAVKDKNGSVWTIPAEWSLEMKMWIGAFGEIKNIVTHWMPLPEPPAKEG